MKLIRHSIAFLKSMRRSSYQDPARDWILMVSLSIITLMGIIVWDAWAFSTAAGGGVLGEQAASTTPAFDSSSINIISTIFEQRSAEEAKYVTGVYKFIDPSQ